MLVSVRQRQGWEGWMGWSGSSVEFQSIFQMSRSPHRWSCCWGKAGSWPPIGRGRGLKAAARPLIGRWSHRSTGAQSWAYISSVSVASLQSCKHCTYTQHRLQIVQILHKHCCEHSPALASVFSSIHIQWTLWHSMNNLQTINVFRLLKYFYSTGKIVFMLIINNIARCNCNFISTSTMSYVPYYFR